MPGIGEHTIRCASVQRPAHEGWRTPDGRRRTGLAQVIVMLGFEGGTWVCGSRGDAADPGLGGGAQAQPCHERLGALDSDT